ncbi:hypothetical protein EJ02DRAFT_419050 [Clathrospora elynae]|uniref:Mating-type alpha-pheromone receptor PreB n=1 Tax=Clathrospora elynae TaxID=706981 RepID=A0A6A5SZ63_9PLEO|nr:hypothetical protein EJ02DRAFT_419050 [Clathrospora elynae]
MESSFDPRTQDFTLLDRNGLNFTASMAQIDDERLYGVRLALLLASQIGASAMLLLVLLLLTKAEKRRSFIFLTNAFCLFANTIRCILLSCYLTGNLWNPYAQLAGDYSGVTDSDLSTNIAARIFTLLVMMTVFVSLTVQVWTVCITTAPLQRGIIMATTTTMACIASGFRVAVIVYGIEELLTLQRSANVDDVTSMAYIVQAVAIWLFSCVFTWKLGHAIIQRRRLRMPQFGPMQIVFIMGCQTMFIPAIFATLKFEDTMPEFGTLVPTAVAIFLPLSAIWAGVVSDSNIASRGPDSHQRLIKDASYRSSASTTLSGSTIACDKSRQMSACTYTQAKDFESAASTPSSYKKSTNHEGIRVDHDFGFARDDAANRV